MTDRRGPHPKRRTLDVPGLGPRRLASLAAVLVEALRRRAAPHGPGDSPRGLIAWGQRYLPHYFTRPPSAMHRWLDEQLSATPPGAGRKLNLIGPRGGAKSTVGTLAWPLRLAVEGREPYLWIVSDTRPQARAHLDNLKHELQTNRRLARDYPAALARPALCRADAIVLAHGTRIEAVSTGQRVRGRRVREHRPSVIVCDDLQNDQHTHSARAREQSRAWFHGLLLKAGTPRTTVLNLATALHRDALALELHRTPGWTSRVFPAVVRWPAAEDLWSAWERIYCDLTRADPAGDARQFYDAHRDAMQAGAELLWPECEDLYTLMCMRVESGRTAFEREKQGNPVNPAACEWPEDYFDDAVWFHDLPSDRGLRIVAVDPSKGADARWGDYSAIVSAAFTARGEIFVEADLARRPTPELVQEIVARCRAFGPDAVGLESNQFQELLGRELVAEAARQGLAGLQPWTIDNRVNKQVRIRRLGPLLASRRFRFRAAHAGTRRLVEQLRDFPVGDHDDGPDALEMAVRLASELTGRPA